MGICSNKNMWPEMITSWSLVFKELIIPEGHAAVFANLNIAFNILVILKNWSISYYPPPPFEF